MCDKRICKDCFHRCTVSNITDKRDTSCFFGHALGGLHIDIDDADFCTKTSQHFSGGGAKTRSATCDQNSLTRTIHLTPPFDQGAERE